MRKTIPWFLSLFILILAAGAAACTPQAAPALTPLPPTQLPAVEATQTLAPAAPTAVQPTAAMKQYTNSAFGLSFQYPSGWFGPDEYVSDQSLRVAVGSDKVYPYGTGMEEQISTVPNAYYVTLQYSKNDQNQIWKDTYQSLANLQDGQSNDTMRSLVIRIRQLKLGRFEGFEYITTLSESAQTEPVYIRQVLLIDDQSNVLTIMGTPNNVQVSAGAGWREVYQMVDEANQQIFHQIVESITVE